MTAPELVVGESQMHSIFPKGADIPQNQMFDLRAVLGEYSKKNPNAKIFDASQGDGGASLPGVPRYILDDAYEMLLDRGTRYGPPHGTEEFRRSVVEDYWGLDSYLRMDPQNVVATCGGRDALLKAYTAAQEMGGEGRRGDFIVTSRVPWISYNWGPYTVGANVMLAPGDERDGWALTKNGILECQQYATKLSREIACLVITSPDNPTGRYTSLDEQIDLIKFALKTGVRYVLLDWMYHWISDLEPFSLNYLLISLDPNERKRVIVLDGLTKSLGGSSIRNAHLVADKYIVDHIRYRASHGIIPSYFGEAVAMAAYKSGYSKAVKSIAEPTSKSREFMRKATSQYGLKSIIGQGYYAFINVEQYLLRKRMRSSAELGLWLAGEHGVAIVPGIYFSKHAANWIRFSYALTPEDTVKTFNRLLELLEE